MRNYDEGDPGMASAKASDEESPTIRETMRRRARERYNNSEISQDELDAQLAELG